METFLKDLSLELRRAEVWIPATKSALRVLLTILLAWVFTRIIGNLLRRLHAYSIAAMESHGQAADRELEKRAATIVAVLRLFLGSIVWLIAIVMALTELGFKI